MRPFVAAVSGILHGNSSSICDNIGRKIDRSEVLHFSDFWDRARLLSQCLEDKRGFDSVDAGSLRSELDRLCGAKRLDCVIVDFPFGRCVKELAPYFDYVFYVEEYPDVALAKYILRDVRRLDADSLRRQMKFYINDGSIISHKIEKYVPPSADMRLKPELTPDEIESLILGKLNALLANRWIML